MTNDQLGIIIEDLGEKRHYPAKWDFACDICEEQVDAGTDFVFMGDKRKVCLTCLMQMIEDLEMEMKD